MSRNQIAFIVGMDSNYDDEELAKTMELIERMKGVEIVEPVMKRDDEAVRNQFLKLTLMGHMNIYFKNLDIEKAVKDMRGGDGS